ncbi:MAG: antibiotic biosynthesis monooxygenase [Acidimicrobiales bacterium]
MIVARKPRAGQEREFERWLQRITDSAARMPGHLGSDLQPPGPKHPDEWVIVYQFDSQSLLDAWIESPLRAELLAEGAGLTEGNARVQQLATSSGDDPVTAVASFRVRDGERRAFEHDYEDIIESMATFDGFLNAQLFPPVEGVQDETVIVFSFRSRPQLDTWFTSDERRQELERLDEHIDGERQLNVVGGFGGWFAHGPRAVKTWKQAATVLLALYPTVLVLNEVLGWLLPDDFPYLLAVLVGNTLGVAILSWILMPRLTTALDSWLRR